MRKRLPIELAHERPLFNWCAVLLQTRAAAAQQQAAADAQALVRRDAELRATADALSEERTQLLALAGQLQARSEALDKQEKQLEVRWFCSHRLRQVACAALVRSVHNTSVHLPIAAAGERPGAGAHPPAAAGRTECGGGAACGGRGSHPAVGGGGGGCGCARQPGGAGGREARVGARSGG